MDSSGKYSARLFFHMKLMNVNAKIRNAHVIRLIFVVNLNTSAFNSCQQNCEPLPGIGSRCEAHE